MTDKQQGQILHIEHNSTDLRHTPKEFIIEINFKRKWSYISDYKANQSIGYP